MTVTTTAWASYDRTYLWEIEKDVDRTEVEVDEDGDATFAYEVTASPDGYDDSGYDLHGTITVTNPNAYKDVTVDVDDAVDLPGVTCVVDDGEDLEVPADRSVTVGYDCTVDDLDEDLYDTGTHTATVTWDGGTATGTAGVDFRLDDETDASVHVYDDKVAHTSDPVLLGEASWEDGPTTFDYSLTFGGEAGRCTDFTNTAMVEETDQSDSETVSVCRQADLVVDTTAEAAYTFAWEIDKVADRTTVRTDDRRRTVGYTVEVTPTTFEDSGWEMDGTVTVTNPNDYKDVDVSLTGLPHLGAGVTCTYAADAMDTLVAAGETRTFDYGCTFEQKPEYDGTDTVTVAWDGEVEASTDVDLARRGDRPHDHRHRRHGRPGRARHGHLERRGGADPVHLLCRRAGPGQPLRHGGQHRDDRRDRPAGAGRGRRLRPRDPRDGGRAAAAAGDGPARHRRARGARRLDPRRRADAGPRHRADGPPEEPAVR